MSCGEHTTAGLYVWKTVITAERSVVRKVAPGMTSMKVLSIFALWTLLLVLEFAAATSTRTQSRTTRSDHHGSMQRAEIIDVGLLDDEVADVRPSFGLDEEIEENGQASELQASKADQGAEFHLPHAIVQKKNKKIAADRQITRGFSGRGEHVGDHYDKKIYAISVTNRELVDNDKEGSDQTVERQIKSSTSSKHMSELEPYNVILQLPAIESLESNAGLDGNDHSKLVKKQLRRKKPRPRPLPQQLENGQPDVDSGGPELSKSSTPHYHKSAEMKQTAILMDGEYESVIRSAASHTASLSFHDEMNQSSEGVEEVVVTEEREEDKKLIPDYNLGEPIKDWNQKRQEWAREHPEVKQEQLFIITGTQPWPCHNAEGDHLLLRCFKNKVDYSRIHGVGLFYNTALLDAHMPTFWAKLPVVRATMLAHPEVEWIWWLDADAIITDMEFSIPLHRYSAYNLVVHGWESLIFEKRSWLGLNAGSFLLRNCQWSLELLERWASMGPKAPMGDAYRHILSDFLPDRPRNPTDDQAALVFLLIKERQRWAGKLRVELDFFLSGYWLELMDGFEATEERYRAMEEQHTELWELLERQGAVGKEKLVAAVGRAREQHLRTSGTGVQQRRAFITHFTGCQPCSGHHNSIYTRDQCHTGLLRALNYADDQVLRTLGYRHRALHLADVLPNSPPSKYL